MNRQPLKHLADVRFSSVDKKSVDGQVPVRLCNYTDVYYNDRIVADMPFMEATATPDQVVRFSLRAGDVLLTKDSETADDIGVSALVAQDLPDVLCGYHLAIARPRSDVVNGRFLRWALAASSARGQLEVAATGVTRFGLRQDAVAGMLVPTPSLAAQRAIADYLDAETASIDQLVTRVRQSNSLLRDRRVGLITEAVMSGVSGGGLAGTTPEHDTPGVALKHLCVRPAEYGLNISPDRYRTGGVRLLRTSDVGGDNGPEDGDRGVFLEAEDVPPTMRLADGDILFSRSGTIGRGFIYRDKGRGACTFAGFLVRFRLQPDVDSRAIHYWSESRPFADAVESGAIQSTISNFSADKYANLKVPRPVVEQSRAIADYLDGETARIDGLMLAREHQIDLLVERRLALITAAVAGQLEIPGVAA